MGAIYSGLVSSDGYLFVTTDTFGNDQNACAIVKVNKYCGALVVTPKGNSLIRVKEVLDKFHSSFKKIEGGLSTDTAMTIVNSFKAEFQKEPSFKEKPLTFLLLLVGCNTKQFSSFEHIFIRNRVIKIMEENNKKIYTTEFDIKPPVQAPNLYYGHSELFQYLTLQLNEKELELDALKLLTYFSMVETQKVDSSLYRNIRMAIISKGNGFKWIKDGNIHMLSDMTKGVDESLSKGINNFF